MKVKDRGHVAKGCLKIGVEALWGNNSTRGMDLDLVHTDTRDLRVQINLTSTQLTAGAEADNLK
jgi:hypothetical protein